jgi:GNAT superfamily N-acetyltransferase
LNTFIDTHIEGFKLKFAEIENIPYILSFIQGMAVYEKLEHEFAATEELLEKHLFGEEKAAEVIIGYFDEKPVSMALFYKSFSTFLAKPGIYLEDLFVIEEMRSRGFGKVMLSFLANLTEKRNCGRLEWSVLDWNKPAVDFYRSIGAEPLKGWTIQRLTGKALVSFSDSFREN